MLIAVCSQTALAQSQRIECEDTCTHIHGIDISHYQGTVFWETISETKMAYVYIKCSEGGDNIDKRYEKNILDARANGLKVGSYHYYHPLTPQKEQLRNLVTQCLPSEQDLLPLIDVETKKGVTAQQLRDSLTVFLNLVTEYYHQKPMVYTGENFYNEYLSGGCLHPYKLMIAKYSDKEPVLKDGKEYIMWQYTEKGRLNGLQHLCDKSRFMGKHGMREIRFRHR